MELEKNEYAKLIQEKEIELNNIKQYANVEYEKLKNEKEQELQHTRKDAEQKYSELEERLKSKEERKI